MSTVKAPGRRRVQSQKISAQQWKALMATLPDGPPYEGLDRRISTRHPRREVTQLLLGLTWTGRPRQHFLVRTRNISRHGMGFVHSHALPLGQRCRVALLTRKQRLVEMTGRVAWCTPDEPGIYRVGLCFDEPVSVKKFLAG